MRTSVRGKLAVAVGTLAAVAFTGGAYAAAQDSRAVAGHAFLSHAAKRLDVTPAQLESVLRAQADAIRQRD